MVPTINLDKCMVCGGCAAVCPTNAITAYRSWIDINKSSCGNCGTCAKICPVGAINWKRT
jgi:formate hydrogenlyase subunit 6/NADH:ubiquinone oxidoreductase subunit I